MTDKKDATNFVPVTVAGKDGKIVVMGLEDDSYVISELKTDNGYTLLKNAITVDISRTDTANSCTIYESDALGLIQNDPRYAEKVNSADGITNHAQKHLEHKLVTASATVDGKKVTMLESNGSKNAEAPLTVVNTRGFDLPKTGDHGTWMYSVGGVLLMTAAAGAMFFALRKRSTAA